MENRSLDDRRHVSLCEILDRVLNKGAVISGEVTISVAEVDLIQLGLQLVIASSGTLLSMTQSAEAINGREAG